MYGFGAFLSLSAYFDALDTHTYIHTYTEIHIRVKLFNALLLAAPINLPLAPHVHILICACI